MTKIYRGQRRNKHRDEKKKFPWSNANVKIKPPLHLILQPNLRNRSAAFEERRKRNAIVMEFTGFPGLIRSQVNYKSRQVRAEKESSRGTAAKVRKQPFKHYYADDPEKMAKALARHVHPRHKRPQAAHT